ncbi:transcriptional regulator [Bacillus sp. Xin]|uniref:transcriptional regulator n=1 Tax=unclassified Bacillus (in: firmicutes) TaxID=185979 RepID=UPI00157445DA|nr:MULTISPECIES: transcriptional regulator [unclassified Bacillus (in: firmicutes)]MBC6973898.1 transcriptional regulator [Bacillus sp. Xin]NSW36113.1 transcriptional regulator [Bacillus sp. Xin1]
MRKRLYIGIACTLFIVLGGIVFWTALQGNRTEYFIMRHMMNENETLATYRIADSKVGTNEATGREALSESAGLWLQYTLDMEDQALFDEQVKVIQNYFIHPTHIVLWKISETGDRQSGTNALVDDLRIIEQLYRAYDMYKEERYKYLADQLSDAVLRYNKKGKNYVDYYDADKGMQNNILTTSYINPRAFSYMKKYGGISETQYQEVIQFLADYPRKGWAFPKEYKEDGTFTYEKQVNMIDQSYVAYHRSLGGISSEAYLDFIKKSFQKDGKLYGRYNLETGKPVVDFESPSAYGITILYVLQAGDVKFAQALYERMSEFRNDNVFSRFYGGYVAGKEKDTHIFDNVLPLLAETKLKMDN